MHLQGFGEQQRVARVPVEGDPPALVRVGEAQGRVDAHHQGRVFHAHQGRRIPLHGHTSNTLLLAEALEMHLKAKRHGADLHKALGNLSRQRVRLLQRVLERGPL
jgi:hypothetical protein